MGFQMKRGFLRLVFAVILFVALFPIMWAVLNSFKTLRDIITPEPKLLFSPTLANHIKVLTTPSIRAGLMNSAVVVGSSVGLSILIGVPAAYAIARYTAKSKRNLQFFLLSLRFLPPVAIVIPFITLWLDIGLYDTYFSVIVTYLLVALSAVVWLSIPVFERIPVEYEEAASMEGYSYFQVFFKIALPIAIPNLVGGFVFSFILLWNELLIALSLTSRNMTLPVAASAFATMGKELPWGVINATAVLLLIPPLVFVGFLGNSLSAFFLPEERN